MREAFKEENSDPSLSGELASLSLTDQSSSHSSPRAPNPVLAYSAAQLAFDQGNLEQAAEQLDTILATNEEFAQAHCLLGKILYLQKHFTQAIAALKTSIKLDQNSTIAHHILGEIYFKQKNLALAAEHLNYVRELDPENAAALTLLGETHRLLAEISQTLGEQDKLHMHVAVAENAYQAAVDIEPSNTATQDTLNELRYKHGGLPIDEVFAAQKGDIWKTIISLKLSNNLRVVRDLIEKKVGKHPFKSYGNNVNGRNAEEHWTPLNVCAGSIVLVKLLVEEYSADVNVRGADGDSTLSLAATLGKPEVIRYLASKGAQFDGTNNWRDNILHICTRNHASLKRNTRNLELTINTIFAILREADTEPADQVNLLRNAHQRKVSGTNLLLRLLTKKNKFDQTVIELADALGKDDLVGIFRTQLALLINERLGGLMSNLFIPVNEKQRPLVVANPKEMMTLSPLYTSFLTRHLRVLPGSFFCSGSPAYNQFETLVDVGIKIIDIASDEKKAKLARITLDNVQAAQAFHSIVEVVLTHGALSPDRVPTLTSTSADESSLSTGQIQS